jgi:hypothetical protein
MSDLSEYDLLSSDFRFLTKDLSRQEPTLAISRNG